MGYQWATIDANFDRSLQFTKVRWDLSQSWNDGFFSELPNINCDNRSWSSITGATWGYAGQYTMNLSAKKCYIRNQSTDSYALYDMTNIATQVDTNIYEYEYSVPLYWGGVSNSSLYSRTGGLGISVLVQTSTFEITPTETAATFESGTTTITVNTDNDSTITWTASTNDSWLSLSTLTGAGDGSVVVTYIGNQSFQSRTGTVTFTSSEGDVLTFTVTQEKMPIIVYDHPIYRSGNLVKKMYRSGNLIYYRLNPETPPCLTVSPVSGSVSASGSVTFTANYKPNCGRDQSQNITSSATWSVSPTGFGTVSNGVFTADNQDTASTSVTVSAVYSGLSATSTVEIDAYEPPEPVLEEYVTMTFSSSGNIKWYAQNNSYTKTIQYSKNGGEWTNITSNSSNSLIPVVAGDVVRFRGDNAQYAPQDGRCSCFSGTTGTFTLSGNIMSLVDSTNFATLSSFTAENVFMNFFNNCTGLTDASDLLLPATALTTCCYQGFLAQCNNLRRGPLLAVETLVTKCYAYFYYHSSSLSEIRCLAVDTSASNCLQSWVQNVQTTSGTFYKNPNKSNWGRGNAGIPNNWTITDYS